MDPARPPARQRPQRHGPVPYRSFTNTPNGSDHPALRSTLSETGRLKIGSDRSAIPVARHTLNPGPTEAYHPQITAENSPATPAALDTTPTKGLQTTRHATVTAGGVRPLAPGDYERIHSVIPGATSYNAETRRLTLAWQLKATTLTQATEAALKTERATLRLAGTTKPELLDVQVRTAADHERDIQHPPAADLVGYKEAGEMLKVSRQRISELEKTRPDFPAPLARLAAEPVFTTHPRIDTSDWNGRRRPDRNDDGARLRVSGVEPRVPYLRAWTARVGV
ncbi:hypothetical protein [Streptomyces sasae]|uniref:hypothetical protein n=1 Tax=Streptomyces sasae TaxID=1266772 RepID=UPI00292F2303|nr:hypothetical protein [Streptomyces sasae]